MFWGLNGNAFSNSPTYDIYFEFLKYSGVSIIQTVRYQNPRGGGVPMYIPVTGYCTELHITRPVKALKFGSKLRQQRWLKKKNTEKSQGPKVRGCCLFVVCAKEKPRKTLLLYYYYFILYHFILNYFMIISVFAGFHLQTIS